MQQNKPYNPNTKYGRRKLREQAKYNYDNGSQEYRDEIDKIGCVTWTIIFVIVGIIFLIIAATSGIEDAIKWLR
jgi:uncharacterized membrane protein YvbJ